MRILHVVHQYFPEQVGGTELYTQWVAHRFAQRENQTDIFFRSFTEGSGLESRLDDDGVRVWVAWSGPMSPAGRFIATFAERHLLNAFCRVIEQVQPELVHIQHLMGLPIALVTHLRQKNIPFIITIHDYWWVCANAQLVTNYSQQLCDGPRAYVNCARCALTRTGHPRLWPAIPAIAGPLAWRNKLLRQVMNTAQTLIAPTKFVKDWYVAHSAPAEKLRVISHGIDLPREYPRKIRVPKSSVRFAYIGGLSWQKGVHVLLEAFRSINSGAELWIAGDEAADPNYASNLRALASPNVRFLGKLTHDKVWETLAQIDVVVVPALWYESFSFIVSEAFAMGVPVVASRLGPLADRVTHEANGLLVSPNNSQALQEGLFRFLNEPALLGRLQQGIQPVVTLDDHVDQIEAVYRDILD